MPEKYVSHYSDQVNLSGSSLFGWVRLAWNLSPLEASFGAVAGNRPSGSYPTI